jgi:hypothetical protein
VTGDPPPAVAHPRSNNPCRIDNTLNPTANLSVQPGQPHSGVASLLSGHDAPKTSNATQEGFPVRLPFKRCRSKRRSLVRAGDHGRVRRSCILRYSAGL